jgi:hypothetical protein
MCQRPVSFNARISNGYDNSYIIDSANKFPGRLLPVVVLDTQDPETPARFTDMVKHQRVRGFRMANTRPAHMVWGSDIGQSLRWSFADKASMARDAASFLSATERALFLHDNAARIHAGIT